MKRIENISDQLHGYAQEAADTVLKIADERDLTFEQSVMTVWIAVVEQLADVFHHIEGHLSEIEGDMSCIEGRLSEIESDLSDMNLYD